MSNSRRAFTSWGFRLTPGLLVGNMFLAAIACNSTRQSNNPSKGSGGTTLSRGGAGVTHSGSGGSGPTASGGQTWQHVVTTIGAKK